MRNPFRSEAEAYRFLLLTIGYFGAIVIATLAGGKWAGLAVFIVITLAALYWFFRREESERPVQTAPRRRGAEDERRILVAANETVGGGPPPDTIRERAAR